MFNYLFTDEEKMTQSLFGRSSGIVGDGKQRILYKEMDGNKRDTIIGKML